MIDTGVIDERLYAVYLNQLSEIDEVDYTGERPHLSCEDVLDAHYLIGDHFRKLGEGIGGFGPKDMNLLASAVGRQLASAGGQFVYKDMWEIASALLVGIITNHPFHDANKRTAFLSSVYFMLEHDYVPKVDIVEVEDFTVEVANHHLEKGAHIQVFDVAPRMKSMFRRSNKASSYVVTYRELRTLLERHGCSLRNPSGNYIDVYRGDHRVLKVGYPGDSKEVGRKAISCIRKATGLRNV
jgi:death-on-curing family protein